MRRSLDGWTEELAGRARAGPGTGPGQTEQARRAGSLPGGAGGPRWRGRRPGARHPPRSRPSLARSRCRTPERWSPRRRTSWHSFGGVCRWRAGRPALSARGGAAPRAPRKGRSRGGGLGRRRERPPSPSPPGSRGGLGRGCGHRGGRAWRRSHPLPREQGRAVTPSQVLPSPSQLCLPTH